VNQCLSQSCSSQYIMSYVSYQTPNITHNSDIFSGSTTPNCHASPAEGREKAAKILIAKETQVNDISSRGSSPTAKIWKSKLKEYYDKLGRVGVQLDYVTKEVPKGGFQCTLFLPEIGYIRGDIGRSKSEAEHSAAYKALQKLNMH